MTIVRHQIHCLVSKNDAVIIVIEDDCDATMFQCRSAQERLAHVHHVTTAVRHHVSVNHFLPLTLQCHIVRCHNFNVCRTHHLEIAVQTMVGRHVQNIQNRSSTRAPQPDCKTDLPNSPCTDVSCCLPARISRVPHLRIQSCSLEINLPAV